MIVGHGIDLQDMAAIKEAYEKRHSFAQKILTETEWALFETLTDRRKISFLAGRWAAKEAIAKALGTGFVGIHFKDIEILTDDKGAPKVTKIPFKGQVHLSISHSGNFVQASAILEGLED